MKLLLKVNSEKTRRRHNTSSTKPWSERVTTNRNNQSTTILQRATKNSTIFIVLLLIVIILAGVAIYFISQSKSPADHDTGSKEIFFGNNYDNTVIPNLGNGHLVIDRIQWGSSDRSVRKHRLEQPIPYVLITHIGVQSVPCYNVYKCSIKMRTIQDAAIAEKNLTDIPANFYVANDGYIYVGRGWDYTNAYANKSLAVCFMGDYIRHQPDEKQLEATQFLLAYGVTNKHIALDYKLVAQNQTKKTKSPGANIYKEVIKWPHWYPCGTENHPKCGEEVGITNWEMNL